MIKNPIIYLGSLLLLMAGSSSCNKDLLDITPKDRLSEESVFRDPAYLEAQVNTGYNGLPNYIMANEPMMSSITDETYMTWDRGTYSVARGQVSPDNPGLFTNGWTQWGAIRGANQFLERIDDASIDEGLKKRLKGEMKFLRAIWYFDMTAKVGGLPLITKVFQINDEFNLTRNSSDEVFEFVLDELEEAAELLPLIPPVRGRISKGAALALRSRAALYYASPLFNPTNDKSRWQLAAEAAKAVIDLNHYQLNDSYAGTFLADNPEIILAKYYKNTKVEQLVDLYNQPTKPGGGWAGNQPLENLVSDYEMTDGTRFDWNNPVHSAAPYENRDPRFYASILADGATWQGTEIEAWTYSDGEGGGANSPAQNPGGGWAIAGYFMKKFTNEDYKPNNSLSFGGEQPNIFFRYGEIYLNYAEALNNLERDEDARTYLNLLRARPSVNMPPVTESGEALKQRIMKERRVELAFEGHRWFDLRRWKTAMIYANEPAMGVAVKKDRTTGAKTYELIVVDPNRKFEEQHYLSPIPRSEIERSPSLTQNPGYN